MVEIGNLEFNKQVRVFTNYINSVFDYVDIREVYNAKQRMYEAGHIIDEDIPIFINFASYVGSLKRIAYYKYCHKQEYDVRALADACVLIFMFNNVYRFEFSNYLRRKEVKDVLNKTRYPKWTLIGLTGGSTSEIIKLGREFSEYMDGLEAE